MSAAPWVLLRGLTREARHWGDFAARLEGRVIALDLPGNGTLHARRSPARVDALAAHCRAELRALGVDTPVRVLAMSLGAMVATAWAVAAPEQIAAAVLINTSLRPFSPFHARLRPASYPALARLVLTRPGPGPVEAERVVLALTSRAARTPEQTDALLAGWAAIRRSAPVAPANALRQLRAAAQFSAPARAPFARVLLLASAADALVSPACSAHLAAAWGCPLHVHAWAGHDLVLDDPAWVAAQVSGWV